MKVEVWCACRKRYVLLARAPDEPLVREFCPETLLKHLLDQDSYTRKKYCAHEGRGVTKHEGGGVVCMQKEVWRAFSFPRWVLESYADRHYHNTSRSFPTLLLARAPEEPERVYPETLLKQSTRPGFVHSEEIWRARRKRCDKHEG